jgi:Tfp pilus assembly protein PilO
MIKLSEKSRDILNTWNKLELDNKKIILIILICLVIIYVDFSFVIKIQFQTISGIGSKIITLKKDIDNLNRNLVLMQQNQKKQTAPVKIKKIISQDDMPQLFQRISDIANKHNVKIMELKPIAAEAKTKENADSSKGEFRTQALALDVSGGYHSLGSFINDLENADEFIVVENFKIVPQQDYFRQKASLLLKTYVKK